MKSKISINSLTPFIDTEGIDKGVEVERKRFSSKVSINADEDRTIVCAISTNDEDADNDVIYPSGADLSRYQKNPVVQWAHDYSMPPIGKAVAISVQEDAIVAKIKFAETERAEEVWQLVKGGFLNANSIGFRIKEAVYAGTEEFKRFIKENKIKVKDTVRRIITKFELLENSIVPIPCNPEALIQAISAKSINLCEKTIEQLELPKVVVVEKVIEKEEIKEVQPALSNGSVENTQLIDVQPKIEEAKEFKKEEPKKFIKVIRSGGVNIDELVKMRINAKKGKIV